MPNSHVKVIQGLKERLRTKRRQLLAEIYERDGEHWAEAEIEQLAGIQEHLDLLDAALEDESEVPRAPEGGAGAGAAGARAWTGAREKDSPKR